VGRPRPPRTGAVGQVLERAVQRINEHLCRHGLLDSADPEAEHEGTEDNLAASAVSGQVPPAVPQWLRSLSRPMAAPLGYDKPLYASLDGFTLHAVTRAGALHLAGREALLRYVLRPPIAQQRRQCVAGGLGTYAPNCTLPRAANPHPLDPRAPRCTT
jgi:hypothetical protein